MAYYLIVFPELYLNFDYYLPEKYISYSFYVLKFEKNGYKFIITKDFNCPQGGISSKGEYNC